MNNISESIEKNVLVGTAYCCSNRADEYRGLELPRDLIHYIREYKEVVKVSSFFGELQPEKVWVHQTGPTSFEPKKDNKWSQLLLHQNESIHENYALAFQELSKPTSFFGVHQPCNTLDVISSNIFKREQSLASAEQAMLFTQQIGAKYFCFHLAQEGAWDWDRREQIYLALKSYRRLAEFYLSQRFTFAPAIEVIEYPLFPATASEACDLLKECQEILPGTKLILDLSHLWRSRGLILENEARLKNCLPDFKAIKSPFSDYLNFTLEEMFKDFPADEIYAFHLGGCWQTKTHEFPGLRPDENPFQDKMRLDEPAHEYDVYNGMNVKATLESMVSYCLEKGQPIRLILEIFNRECTPVHYAVRNVREDVLKKVRRKYEKARSLVQTLDSIDSTLGSIKS